MIWFTRHPTPIGELMLVKRSALEGIYLDGLHPPTTSWRMDARAFDDEVDQLDAYFAGERTTFDLEMAPVGTPFQTRVWNALSGIGYGETSTYGAIARRVGRATAVRAVGAANGRNPLAIVVPCHRVIGSTGALVGYAGGLATKKWLLEHEKRHRRRYTLMMGTPSCAST
jgi:methylated-DNA-[protein]-cysteine S-methyltransferase